jgi:hypothetical protein
MRSKELSIELRDRIVSRHRSGEGYQTFPAALKVPKNTVASIILKWMKFGTTETLPRVGHPDKLSNRGRRALVREVTNGYSDRGPLWRRENLTEGQPSLQHFTNQTFMVGRPDGSPLLSKRHMAARLEFVKRHLKHCGLNAKRHVWRKPGTKQ